MFTIAIAIGIFSYSIFLFGVFGFLYKNVVVGLTMIFLAVLFLVIRKMRVGGAVRAEGWVETIFVFLVVLQILVNVIGVLGPELAFDALWYHVTLPKLYLLQHKISYIPGGLLYYSAMPQFIEMFYIAGLSFRNEIVAKCIHFVFFLLTVCALYRFSIKRISREIAYIIVLIFAGNLVVNWEAITAYVDLGRTFYEFMALWGFIEWIETKKNKWFIVSAVMVGFSIASKLLAIGSLIIFIILISYQLIHKESVYKIILRNLQFIGISLGVATPWFLYSFYHTGNPVHPFFSSIYHVSIFSSFVNPLFMLLYVSDPISPIYLISIPLVFLVWKKWNNTYKLIAIYSLLGITVWYITPNTGGGRFILPYLPALSVVVGLVIHKIEYNQIKKFLILVIILISFITIAYRTIANAKYIPVLLGKETKSEFLTKNLNFDYGDFYDTDGFFSRTIHKSDKVLLYGFHNLYYIDFPFIDSSWVKKGDSYNYIATQNTSIPSRFNQWQLVYNNKMNHVQVYTLDKKIHEF